MATSTSTQSRNLQNSGPSAMIEKKAMALSRNIGITAFSCNWNSKQGINQSSLPRLNICANGRTAHIYFTDHEISAYWNGSDTNPTDIRLERAIDELHEIGVPSDFLYWMQNTRLPPEKF